MKTLLDKNSEVLSELLAEQEAPCASILLNLLTAGNALAQNVNLLEKEQRSVLASMEMLRTSEASKESLTVNLESAIEQFRNDGRSKAIGIFASPKVSHLVEFPFLVNECTVVGSTFQVRDLLYFGQYLEPYYALSINRNSIHLFRGSADSLTEIHNQEFPATMEDDYEYAPSSIGSSYGYALKAFEKDKGVISHTREESFVKSVCRKLGRLINNPSALLVMVGPSRLLSEAASLYTFPDNVHKIAASFSGKNFGEFCAMVWKKVTEVRRTNIDTAISRLGELPINSRAKGVRAVWEAAKDGRGLLLLVERDFQRLAYKLTQSDSIRLHPPGESFEKLPDVVDDVIETVRSRHGRIVFAEHGQLSRYEGIALTLRY